MSNDLIAKDQEMLVKDFWTAIEASHNIGPSRHRRNVVFKHAFFAATRELTNLSLKSIGNILNKDHATVLYAIRSHQTNYTYDAQYRNVYDEIFGSMAKIVDGHNEDLYDLIERRMQSLDIEGFNSDMIEMYRRKLETQATHYDETIEHLKKQNAILLRNLKSAQQRAENLNEEALRLKNLL